MQYSIVSTAVGLALCISAIGCDTKRQTAVVTIQSAKPSGEVWLLEGDRVQFEVVVRAQGFDSPRKVALIVQSADQAIGMAGPVTIESGQVVTLRTDVVIPRTSTVEVITPLFLDNEAETSIIDNRYYKVIGRRG
jgi:hypothetical protein